MKRKLTAFVCCLVMAFGTLAVTASPASAHHEQSCTTTYGRVPMYDFVRVSPWWSPVPVYEKVFVGYTYEPIESCTTITHPIDPPEYHPRDRFEDCVNVVITAGPGSVFWNDLGVIACLATSGG